MNRYRRNKLHGRIIESYGNLTAFADAVGISRQSVYHLLQGAPTSTRMVEKIRDLLGISQQDVGEVFFPIELKK